MGKDLDFGKEYLYLSDNATYPESGTWEQKNTYRDCISQKQLRLIGISQSQISTVRFFWSCLFPESHRILFERFSFEVLSNRGAFSEDFTRFWMPVDWKKGIFHVLRHTFATRCVEAKIDIKTLSEILGHSSVTITMNRYVHPSFGAEAGKRWNSWQILFPSNKPQSELPNDYRCFFAIIAEWATLRQKIIPTTHLCIVVHRIDSGVKGTFDSTAEIRLLRI